MKEKKDEKDAFQHHVALILYLIHCSSNFILASLDWIANE